MIKSVTTTWDSGKKYIEKVFSNAKPQIDEISVESSGWQRDTPKFDPESDFDPDEEKQMRQELTQSSQSIGED